MEMTPVIGASRESLELLAITQLVEASIFIMLMKTLL